VFDLFVQGERSIDRSQGGLGIGLTLVRRLAELHGGSVQVESDGPDCGAAFTVRLPLAQPPAVHPGAVDAPGPARPLRVALIEDNEDVRAALRLVLEADGHMVRDASDGQSGLQLLLSAADLDVALVDIGLPIVGGLEIARRVRDSGRTQPVLIAMTGYGGEQDRARGIKSGFDAYLVKPVDQDALRRMLDRLTPRDGA
jgi:CheY-like chemotaxis protein